MNPLPLQTSRRRFLRTTAGAAFATPFIMRDLIARPPSSQVVHASFGAGGMAWADLNEIASHKSVRIVAVADVDATRTGEFRKKFPEARVYADYRQLLDKEKLDSVNVSTPDHMHAPQGMAAMQRGIHVYGQKPLTHNLYECRRLTEVAKQKKLVTQMGIQIHSATEYRLATRLVQDGVIGKVREVHTWSSKEWGDNGAMPDRKDPVPTGLDWNLWLGVCADRPFIGQGWYHPGNWRRRLDFGTGTFGDMGCHIFDPVFSALGLTAPISVKSLGAAPSSHSWATNAIIEYIYPATPFTIPGTVPVTWYDGRKRPPADIVSLLGKVALPDQGSIIIGTQGVMVVPHVGRPILLPAQKYDGFKYPDVGSANHWHEFIDAVSGKGTTSAGFDYSGPLTESVLLGSVATRFPNQLLEWNSAKLKFTNVAAANQHVRRTYRKGWETKGL
jgi:predicted dehydrogenase